MFVIFAVVIFVIFCLFIEKILRSIKVGGIAQKHVFITGCDSGFGQKLAIQLDGLGFPVFAACLTEDGEKFLSENASTRLTTLSLDVTKTESIQKALDFVKQKLPPGTGLWAVVNNAGIFGPVIETELFPLEEFRKTIDVNVFGTIAICRKFLPLVRKCKGRIVNMGSVMGRIASPTNSPYNTSKFAVEGFTDTLRREVYHQGINVSLIEPGIFVTGFFHKETVMKTASHYFDLADDELKAAYSKAIMRVSNGLDFARQISSQNVNLVVDAYTHAIASRFPKTRYVVGWDARLMFIPGSYLPAAFVDWIWIVFRNRKIYKS